MLTIVGTVAFDTLALVRELPARDTTAGIEHLRPDLPGGTAGNVAVALARLGASCRLVAVVGDDFDGSPVAASLRDAGLALDALVRAPGPTARAYVFSDASGHQMTCFYPGVNGALASAGVRLAGRAHFAAGDVASYPPLMRQAEWVSFDPGQEVFHRDVREILACLPEVDCLFVNEHELARLVAAAGSVAALRARGPGTVVETRGRAGSRVHGPDGVLEVPALDVVARDPTGAGDAHRAGFLYALDRGASVAAAARFATVLGSFAVEQVGAQAGLPTLPEAEERYRKAYGDEAF